MEIHTKKKKKVNWTHKKEKQKNNWLPLSNRRPVSYKKNQDKKFWKNPYKGPFAVISSREANVKVNEEGITDVYNLR